MNMEDENMPYISTKTNRTIGPDQQKQLKERLGKAIALLPGKSETWLMLSFEGDIPMAFQGNDNDPAAMFEVKIFGSAPAQAKERLTAELTDTAEKILGVPGNRTYVKYEECSDWGWNGSNF